MKTRDDNTTDLFENTSKDEKPFFLTKSYRPEKIYEPTEEEREEDKKRWAENAKNIIISGPLYFDKQSQMWFYKQNNGNLMADGLIDGQTTSREEDCDDNQQMNRYFCHIL